MNIRSARFRITAWYSLSLSLATIIIFLSFFVVTQQTLYNRVDSELTTHGNTIVQLASSENTMLHGVMLNHIASDEFQQTPGMLVVILDAQGKVIQSSLANDSFQSTYQPMYKLAIETNTPVFQNETIADSQMRFYAKSIFDKGRLIGVVLVAHPIDVIQKSLNSLLFILGAVFVVLIIPMILGGYGIARGVMKPLASLIEKLKIITSEHLHERIKNPHTGDEMEELTVTFNSLLDRLQHAFQRERQFIGDVAHELKTPLATLQSGLEVTLSKTRTKEEYKEALQEALIDTKKQSQTLNSILDLAWSEAMTKEDKRIQLNLTELLEELGEITEKLGKQKDLNIEKVFDKDIYVAGVGSKEKLAQALLNILENAVKYTPQNGTIKLTAKKENNHAKIQISDTGIGIAQKDLPHIFERFYRGEGTDKTKGSGLGMAIAQSIIHAHQGKIHVKSPTFVKTSAGKHTNKGTTVTIILPIMR